MLHVPRPLVQHDIVLTPPQHLQRQPRDIRLVRELCHGREQALEVEDYGAREGQAAQGLPVDAQVAPGDGEPRELVGSVLLVRVAGGHEERFVDFEAPTAALDGLLRGEFGEETGCGWGFSLVLLSLARSCGEDCMKNRKKEICRKKKTHRSMLNRIFSA